MQLREVLEAHAETREAVLLDDFWRGDAEDTVNPKPQPPKTLNPKATHPRSPKH